MLFSASPRDVQHIKVLFVRLIHTHIKDMRMKDPVPQFSHVVSELATRYPNLAYIHAVEPRVDGIEDAAGVPPVGESLDFMRDIWRRTGRPFLSAGGFKPASALEHMTKPGYENEMVVFGRLFIANVSISFPLAIHKLISRLA